MRLQTTLLPLLTAALLSACVARPAPPAALPPASDAAGIVRRCDALRPPEDAGCYETALLDLLRTEGVGSAMQRLEQIAELSPEVRRDGHVFAHAIGLAAFSTAEEVGRTFGECSPAFQSGCYHGVIQSYFADHVERHGAEHLDAATVNALCANYRDDPSDRWQLFQCAHGIGHGLTMVFDHHLPRALQGCDLILSPWEREGCYGGAFMENIVQATHPHHEIGRPQVASGASPDEAGGHAHHGDHSAAAAEPFKALDPADPLYPCSVLDERYLHSCYQMQTSAILFFNQGRMEPALRACDTAPERFRPACYQSLGRDISSYTLQDHAEAVRLCSQGDARFRPFCHAGYAKNLVDLTARAADGFAYCRAVADPEGKRACYQAVGEEIWVLAGDEPAREAMCGQAEPAFRQACRRGAALTEAAG